MKAKNEAKRKELKDGEFDYGSVEMTDQEYQEAQDPKIRTTIFLDASLIRAYKQQATKQGAKYQQLIRDTLRKALSGGDGVSERLARLENVVFKKRA